MQDNGSALFRALGLGGLDLGVLLIIAMVLIIVLMVMVIIQKKNNDRIIKRYEVFMQGAKARSLEGTIQELVEDVKKVRKESAESSADVRLMFNRQMENFRKMGLYRYDAFKEVGGKMSFCLTLLDEGNNGFVMNCVHTATGCYSYAKEIKGGKSSVGLGEEEQAAVDIAISGSKGEKKDDRH